MSKQIEALEKQLEISKKELAELNAFDFDDKLDRRKLAKNFISVLTSQNANVFSINGSWGSGKTWFLKFIEEECKKEKIPFVQFNVWKNDYLNDPFSAIIAELSNLLGFNEDQIKELTSKLTLNASIGFMGNNVGFQYDPTKNISEYKKLKREKEDFIKLLTKKIKKQTIIAIDELDRCRPDYAIRTLEIIKHFFNIEGLKFILAVDKQQLQNTVKALYGQEADTDCYLRKFVDVEYNLPVPKSSNMYNYVLDLVTRKYPKIYSFCIEKNSTGNILSRDDNSGYFRKNRYGDDSAYMQLIIKSTITSSHLASLELRDIEKLFLKLDIIINNFKQVEAFNFDFLYNLLIINLKHNDLYILIENPEISFSNVLNYLKIITGDKNKDKYYDFVRINSLLTNIIDGVKHTVDSRYAFARGTTDFKYNVRDELTYLYSEDLRKYFEIINLSEGFE